jgi:hypothetical protein
MAEGLTAADLMVGVRPRVMEEGAPLPATAAGTLHLATVADVPHPAAMAAVHPTVVVDHRTAVGRHTAVEAAADMGGNLRWIVFPA